ncbi:MAG TPA: LytTR family DNA-binding domain-containing protein [Steroidobacteraceae bacterium]|nr:LytTR family DNA-binding domain-containing protein [Steroidobacteraceae bacterium]
MDTIPPAPDEAALRALIVDDEPPARERLRRLLEEMPRVSVIAEAGNGREALELCAAFAPDVVLLDIRMPGMDGIEAARHLGRMQTPPAVIFTTAYDEHALAAFETQALGYLLKPVRREKLARAIRHAARLATPQLLRLAEHTRLGQRRTQLCARHGEQLRLIPVEDIYFFCADQKYVTVRHRHGSDLIDESLRALAEEFSPEFLRIHRNSLVALRHVRALERNAEGQYLVRFKEAAETLPVSRRHAAGALRQFRSGLKTWNPTATT